MYAVIEAGGKQYRVEVGTELEVDLIDAAPGDSLAIERVLLIAAGDRASIGRPTVANASVAAEVVDRHRGEKVISFKYRPKARRRVKKGHRQELTLIRISDIVLDGKSAAGERAKADEARKTARMRLEEAARKQAEQDAALAAQLAKAKAKSEKAEAAKAAPSKSKAATAEPSKSKPAKAERAKSKPAKAEPAKAEPAKAAKKNEQNETNVGGQAGEQSAAKPRRARKGDATESTE
ncbi:MAG: 50S ribosomal protein L21 [Chloroflexi bacterium]|nr:50S ribosomal protein L21 [Chloroflexota bacterium]